MLYEGIKNAQIKNALDIEAIMRRIYSLRPSEEQHKEYFYAIGLNPVGLLLYIDLISIGTINACVPFIREVLRMALLKNAASVMVFHNHPSGSATPSNEDRRFMLQLTRACNDIDIKLLDFLIGGYKWQNNEMIYCGYFSAAEKGEI